MKHEEDDRATNEESSSTTQQVEAYTQKKSGKPSNTSDIEELTSSRNRAVNTMRKKARQSDF